MGLLVGLPLVIFRLCVRLRMRARRLAVPLAASGVLVMLYRRSKGGQAGQPKREKPKEPEFDGPVYTVDYEEVDGDEDGTP